MRHQLVLTLSALSLGAAVAGAQDDRRDDRRDDRVRIYSAPLAAARALSSGGAARSAIGVSTQPSGGLRDTLGLLVGSVASGGPAEKAGITEGDRIQAINAVSLLASKEDAEDWGAYGFVQRRLTRELDKVKPGDAVTLKVYAAGRTREVRVTTVDPDSLYRSRVSVATGRRLEEVRARADSMRKVAEDRPTLGISLGSTGSMRDTLGVLVMGVAEGGPAEKAGIEEGTRIQAVDGVDLRASRDEIEDGFVGMKSRRLSRAVQAKKPGDVVELRLYTAGQTRTVRVTMVRAGDLPGRGRGVFFYGDAVPPMPMRAPMPPRLNFGFQMDGDDFSFRDLDDLRIEIDGERIGRELERIGPMVREKMEMIGPEIRWNLDRALRDAHRGIDLGLDGLDAGLEGVARALEGLDLRIEAESPRVIRSRRADADRATTPIATKAVTSF